MQARITTRVNLDAAGCLGRLIFQIAALEGASMFRPGPRINRTIEVQRDGTTLSLDYDRAGQLAEELMDAKDELIATLRNSPLRDDRFTLGTCLDTILEHYRTA